MRSFRPTAMRPALVISLLAATLLGAACSTYDSTSRKVASAITPYRINIVQGNFVSREAADQLKEGMSRDQVKFLLGTPLLTDVFHANRWDYVFSFRRGSTPVVQQRRFTVFFQDDKLARWGGDELPSEYELIAEIDGMKSALKNQTPGKISMGSSSEATAPASGSTPAAPTAPAGVASPEATATGTTAKEPDGTSTGNPAMPAEGTPATSSAGTAQPAQ